MAIKKITSEPLIQSLDSLYFEVDNGDLIALKEIVQKYNFSNEENALRFALAVLVKSEGKGVYIEDDKGGKVQQVPGDSLIKQEVDEINPE